MSSGKAKGNGERVVIYGDGGIGKSSLASLAPKPRFLDLQAGTSKLNIERISVSSFQETRDALHTPELWKDVRTVVIDEATSLQTFATEHVTKTVKHAKGKPIRSIEDYDYGKGYQFVFEHFLQILGDLDAHMRAGRNVILICHQIVDNAPNPDGENFLCYEPALQQPPKTGQLRSFVRDWCDHMLFISLDKKVTDGRAVGQGSRTIWPQGRPTFWAKSRDLREPVVYQDPEADPEKAAEVWRLLGQK